MSHKVGIANVGNICFMSAVLQALRHCPDFMISFWKPFVHREKKGEAVCFALHDLFTKMLAANPPASAIDPRSFVRVFADESRKDGRIEYRFTDQLDASEFLQYLLETVHGYLSRRVIMEISDGVGDSLIVKQQTDALKAWSAEYTKEYSPMVEFFYGQSIHTTTCVNCKKQTSQSFEPWCKIEAAIPNSNIHGARAPTLIECLRHSFSDEIVEDYACDLCHVRSTCKKTHRVTRLPKNIIIVLKRFTNTGGKVSGGILWDLDNLDLSDLYAFASPFKTPPPSYRTYGVIEHSGRTGYGHYFMRARTGETWTDYNDSAARPVPTGSVVTDNSYIIFATSDSESYDSFHTTTYPAYKAEAEALFAAKRSSAADAGSAAGGSGSAAVTTMKRWSP